jgi:hypothetical protein
MSRRRHLIAALLWFLPIQLLCGLVFVLHAQAPLTAVEQKISDDVGAISARVQKLEELHLEGRLAVLDALSDRSWRIELLVIGLFLTTAGHLFLQAWSHRASHSRRSHVRYDDDRED